MSRTPLGRVRGLGSAKEGTHHWWLQRVTAIALVPLTLWFVISVIGLIGKPYPAVAGWIGNPLVSVFLILLLLATFWHAYLGLQVVIEDYVHSEAVKITMLLLVKFACFILGAGATYSILLISLAG